MRRAIIQKSFAFAQEDIWIRYLIDGNGSEFTFIYTGFTSDTSICTAGLTFGWSASPITCNYSRAIWKFLLYCHIQHFLSYGVPVRGRLYCLSPFHLKYASAIAGAVGIEVISPIPMAPQATFSPGLSTTMASIFGISWERNRPSAVSYTHLTLPTKA